MERSAQPRKNVHVVRLTVQTEATLPFNIFHNKYIEVPSTIFAIELDLGFVLVNLRLM